MLGCKYISDHDLWHHFEQRERCDHLCNPLAFAAEPDEAEACGTGARFDADDDDETEAWRVGLVVAEGSLGSDEKVGVGFPRLFDEDVSSDRAEAEPLLLGLELNSDPPATPITPLVTGPATPSMSV